MKNISFESSDLCAKVGQTVIGSYDEHGLGEYLIVAKRPLEKTFRTPFGGYRFFVKWALDDRKFAAAVEARKKASHEARERMAAWAALYKVGRNIRPDLAAREDNLRQRADEFSGRKRHRFVNRANRVHGEIVEAGRSNEQKHN